ncbi:MAG: hypothetical protein CL915_14555 [Deltaproteobacteria bacterium]|nr:hypothetical protein [Deltaproteobacteria bacterium]
MKAPKSGCTEAIDFGRNNWRITMNLPKNSENYRKSNDRYACTQNLSRRSKPILEQVIVWWSPQKSSHT